MIKKILLAIVFIIELLTTKLWFACRDFSDSFHFSRVDMIYKLEADINNDKGMSYLVVRIFHNRFTFFINQVFSEYIRFWDIRFGVLYLSIIGYFGLLCGFWYLVSVKQRYKWFILIILLILPYIEVFRLPLSYQVRLLVLSIPYQVLSIFGLWQFIKSYKKKGVAIIIFLIILSLWYNAVLNNDIFLYCLKR